MTEERDEFFKDIDVDPDKQYFISNRSRLATYDIKHLIISPHQFFSSGVSMNRLYVFITCWIAGAAFSFEREGKLLKQYINNGNSGNQLAYDVSNSWASLWPFTLSIGLISGAVLWWAGGWWYNQRLKMVWISEINKSQGQRVYIFNRLIHDIPVLVFALIQTILYTNFRTSFFSDDVFMKTGTFVLYVLLHISVINSYRSVIRIFPVEKDKAQKWFLTYPIVLYNFLIWIATT